MPGHGGGCVDAVLHFVDFFQTGDEAVTGALSARIGGDIQPEQVFIGIQGDGRIGKAHEIAVFFMK